MMPSVYTVMPTELKETIRQIVLNDGAPLLIQAIIDTCEEEAERLRKIDIDRFTRDGPEPEPRSPAEWTRRDAERKTDPWLWWTMFAGRHLHYVVEHMREAIEQRDWTNAQKDAHRKAQELKAKREELSRLERA